MAVLLHLNGPPGIGKSTIAQRFVDEHPGVLNLDVDRLRALVGGWEQRFAETGEIVRPLALAMTRTHLGHGRDVVLPQYLGRLDEIAKFQGAATESGAAFVEVVLMDDKRSAVRRFADRGTGDADPWHDQVKGIVAALGGEPALASMHDRLVEVVAARPQAIVVQSVAGAVDDTYAQVCAALSSTP